MFCGDDAEEMLHRFESDFEQKSEIFRTQIWTKSVRNLQDFAPSILNKILNIFENFAQKFRFGLDLEQKSDRFQAEIWSKSDRNLVDFRSNPLCIFGRALRQLNSFWGDDAEAMLDRFESDFDQKCEIFWTEIWTKSVRNLQDFARSFSIRFWIDLK